MVPKSRHRSRSCQRTQVVRLFVTLTAGRGVYLVDESSVVAMDFVRADAHHRTCNFIEMLSVSVRNAQRLLVPRTIRLMHPLNDLCIRPA
jgi:hypothetical protein